MDEPLSALDRRRKDEILPFLERLHDAPVAADRSTSATTWPRWSASPTISC